MSKDIYCNTGYTIRSSYLSPNLNSQFSFPFLFYLVFRILVNGHSRSSQTEGVIIYSFFTINPLQSAISFSSKIHWKSVSPLDLSCYQITFMAHLNYSKKLLGNFLPFTLVLQNKEAKWPFKNINKTCTSLCKTLSRLPIALKGKFKCLMLGSTCLSSSSHATFSLALIMLAKTDNSENLLSCFWLQSPWSLFFSSLETIFQGWLLNIHFLITTAFPCPHIFPFVHYYFTLFIAFIHSPPSSINLFIYFLFPPTSISNPNGMKLCHLYFLSTMCIPYQ